MKSILEGIQAYIKDIKEHVFKMDDNGNYPNYLSDRAVMLFNRLIGLEPSGDAVKVKHIGLTEIIAVCKDFFIVTIGDCNDEPYPDGTESGGYSILIIKRAENQFEWHKINVLIANPDKKHCALLFASEIIDEETAINFMVNESIKGDQTEYRPSFGYPIEVVPGNRPGSFDACVRYSQAK